MKTRILLCSRGSVYYNTAQFLSKLLAPLGKEGKSFISDSKTFVKKVLDSKLSGRMVSYDVVDLFTNIPLYDALDILRAKLDNCIDTLETRLSIDSIINLVASCFQTSYFTWQNNVYQQIHGLPMGSPLSPLITEIFMSSFEESALLSAPFQPSCWYRKVDDTFTILNPDHDPTIHLDHLNKQHPRIKFTMETEDDQHKLPFLDVSLNNTSSKITTSVYRKPTHTDQYIHFLSNHHPQIKRAIISTLTRRAKTICDPAKLQEEIDHLRHTFVTLNGYPKQLVDQTISATLQPKEDRPPKPESAPIRVNIPYQGKISHQISRLLKKTASIDVTFSSDRTLKTILKANGRGGPSQTQTNPRGCVYKINCNCGSSYIGETCRPFSIRLKEHKSSVEKSNLKSALSEHIVNNPNHSINWQQTQILASNYSDWRKRKLIESINIRRIGPEMNRDEGVHLPSAWCIT